MREYCELHGISSQCIPALAASLFLPWKSHPKGGSAVLPLPRPSRTPASELRQKSIPHPLEFERCLQNEYRLLPYYMTLSCNIHGLRALLAGSFFDAGVPCNLVSPWLQPIFEIIDPIIARGDFTSFAVIMSKRQPRLVALWLGASIIGMEKTILQPVRNGLFSIELHAAAWTGTVHSFINLRPHMPRVTSHEEIDRRDECRLLFLTGSESHQRPPICPWQPFGTTPLTLAEIEVQQHAACTGHYLQYVSWRWDTEDGLSYEDLGYDKTSALDMWDVISTEFDAAPLTTSTTDSLKSELLSEAATRSIFGWLRVDGYPPFEKAIFSHDWFDGGSSSGESGFSAGDSPVTEQSNIKAWLDKVE